MPTDPDRRSDHRIGHRAANRHQPHRARPDEPIPRPHRAPDARSAGPSALRPSTGPLWPLLSPHRPQPTPAMDARPPRPLTPPPDRPRLWEPEAIPCCAVIFQQAEPLRRAVPLRAARRPAPRSSRSRSGRRAGLSQARTLRSTTTPWALPRPGRTPRVGKIVRRLADQWMDGLRPVRPPRHPVGPRGARPRGHPSTPGKAPGVKPRERGDRHPRGPAAQAPARVTREPNLRGEACAGKPRRTRVPRRIRRDPKAGGRQPHRGELRSLLETPDADEAREQDIRSA